MKHKVNPIILIAVIFSAILAGCGNLEFNIEDNIKPPEEQVISVQGTWNIEAYIPIPSEKKGSGQDESIQKMYQGKNAIFDGEIGAIGNDVCTNPQYKTTRTDSDDFIRSRYRTSDELLGLHGQKVDVITMTADNQVFNQLILTDDETAYVYIQNGFLMLKKISGSVDLSIKRQSMGYAGMNMDEGKFKEDPLLRSGVLIGIRSEDNTYKTLWIYSKNREIMAASSRKQLMVPRKTGFWEIGAYRDMNSDESIYVKPFIDVDSQQNPSISNSIDLLHQSASAGILFVGNDYFGIESGSKFSVIPIDNIRAGKNVTLSDIADQNSLKLFKQSGEAFIASLDKEKAGSIIADFNEENFTLKRRNGHWVMRSRIYYKEPVKGRKYEDFDLSLMVPSNLIHYDEMSIPWNDIKSSLPWTTDAYMSPNKDIAILVSGDSINIYPIQNMNIINKQLMKIPLADGDSIVMTEWAIGKYADIWSNFVTPIFTDIQNIMR